MPAACDEVASNGVDASNGDWKLLPLTCVDCRPGGGEGGPDATAPCEEIGGYWGAAPKWHSAAVRWFVSWVPGGLSVE